MSPNQKNQNNLFAKITQPIPGDLFPRKRLFRLLNQVRSKPIVFINGPAGSGKTSLVTSYLEAYQLKCIWYQVDEGDVDLATFFYYMGLAARNAAPRYKKPLPLFTPEYGLGVPTFARRYFENLYSRLHPPYVLVFDNYQNIPLDSIFHEVIRIGVSVLPKNISMVVISRSEVPGAFAALSAGNQLQTIDWDDLKLTPEETKGIIKLQKPARLHPKLYGWLHEKVDGWVAGLMLMVRGMKSLKIETGTLEKLSKEQVFDFFAHEIFNRTDKPLQQFLLKTAWLPKITPQVAEILTGYPEAEKILSNLHRNNSFTEKRGQPEATYQYHSLFREFLMNQAAMQFSPEDLTHLKVEAAKLLEASGQIGDAAQLLIEAKAWKGLTTLIRINALALIRQGRNRMLERWITALPEAHLKTDSWMNYWLGICRLPFNPKEGQRLLEIAFRLFEVAGDETGALLAWSGIVQTFMYIFDDFKPLDQWIGWLDAWSQKQLPFPSSEIALNVAAGMTSTLTWRNPVHPNVKKWVDLALSLAKESENIELATRAYTNCAVYMIWMGEFDQCTILISEMKRMIASQPVSPLRSLVLKHTEAMFYNTSADLQKKGLQSVLEGLEEARRTGVHIIDPLFYNQGVVSCLNEGIYDRAEEFLSKLEKSIRSGSRTHIGHFYYLSACYHLNIGKTNQAIALAQKSLELLRETGTPVSEVIVRLVLIHALLESGDEDAAERELTEAERVVTQTGSDYLEYLYDLTKAYFEYLGGNDTAGLQFLRKAMALGKQKGFTTALYFWRPSVMSLLCEKALEKGIEVEYVKHLIQKLNLIPDQRSIHTENWPWPVKVYLLGGFQIFVDGKPVHFLGKVKKKPLLLIKALIALGGKDVKEEKIEDILWPDAEGDVAHQSFEITLHRLRKLLGHPDAFDFSSGLVTLNPNICWTDVWAFENLVEEAGIQEKQGRVDFAIDLTEKAISLYRGTFLPGEANEPWTVSMRERLRRKFLRIVIWLGRQLEEAGKLEKALDIYHCGLEVDQISEEFYQQIMICYQCLGRKAEALDTYKRCREVLSATLGVKPSPKTESIFKSLL